MIKRTPCKKKINNMNYDLSNICVITQSQYFSIQIVYNEILNVY